MNLAKGEEKIFFWTTFEIFLWLWWTTSNTCFFLG